ncbi:hypothetical protein F183_A27730 [Bryobacterales bacterium F-183]|nr:hypothetical protein F183_A27730 [Bryobacterales bacterium F-183]
MKNTNFVLFGLTHWAILISIPLLAWLFAQLAHRLSIPARTGIRVALGGLLMINELIWYVFKARHNSWQFPGTLPLQLCDVILWMTVIAMLLKVQWAFEFAFLAGLVGTSMAIITPDLWEPFPTYPTVYFFLAHGGIVMCVLYLWWSREMRLLPGCVWRVLLSLNVYAAALGVFNWIFQTNYMYLCRKPESASVLDYLGPWPVYILGGELIGLLFFTLLWLPFRRQSVEAGTR